MSEATCDDCAYQHTYTCDTCQNKDAWRETVEATEERIAEKDAEIERLIWAIKTAVDLIDTGTDVVDGYTHGIDLLYWAVRNTAGRGETEKRGAK